MGKGQPACDTAAEAWCPSRPPWMVAAKQNHVIAAKLNCGNASPAAGSPGWQEGIRPVMTPYSYNKQQFRATHRGTEELDKLLGLFPTVCTSLGVAQLIARVCVSRDI